MAGTKYESPIYYIDNGRKIKVMIISGIHGNEIGGIKAAARIIEVKPDWANFIIIPRSNTEAVRNEERNPYYMSDLNRAFPGKPNGTDTEVMAYEIFKLVEKESPDIVMDLHEWERNYDEDSSFLANGLILDLMDSKFMEITEKVYDDYIIDNDSTKIMLDTSSLNGSFNKEVSDRLGIPVLTIESNMNDKLENRISFHLYVIERIINYFR
ncbi:MAG: succinylglutamate desuccinylase/aspartoacylase family protein [Tissierellia bacterium]|nr:succinylglutamate desuccinylase/aspartoacylase family protein [Tissierellia bacterium]MDD4725945.1 succinylglutamate desuccinylase/aspartoacylase family protein [Tissierellia bacterium]